MSSLGFQVSFLSARVAMANAGFGPPFDHLMLAVSLNDTWLADVGFGDSFTRPLRLQSGLEQTDRDATYMVLQLEGEWALCRRSGAGRWETLLLLSLEPRHLRDFQERCSWTQTSPDSHFRAKPVCTRLTDNGRSTLSGTKMIVRIGDRKLEADVSSDEEMRVRLLEGFGVVLN